MATTTDLEEYSNVVHVFRSRLDHGHECPAAGEIGEGEVDAAGIRAIFIVVVFDSRSGPICFRGKIGVN